MLNYFIADDEEIIRNGLKCIIDWKDCGFMLCGEASNGKDAVSQIIDLRPHLVMLDIKMPGMTGIDVIKQVTEYFTKNNLTLPAFIILTGFSEFEFAKDALNYGAKAYLLKPVDEDELEKNVRNIAKEINEQKNLKENSKNAKELETKDYLLKLIKTEASQEMKNPTDSVFFEDSENSFYQAVIFNLDYYPAEYKKELTKAINNYFSFFTKVIMNQNEDILLIIKTSNAKGVKNCIERVASLHETRTFITSGENCKGLDGLVKSYNQATENKKFLFYFDKEKCISPELAASNQNLKENSQSEEKEQSEFTQTINKHIETLIFCIETYDKKKLESTKKELYECFFKPVLSESVTKKNIIYCLLELRNRITSKYPQRDITDGSTFDVVPNILEKKTFEQVFEYFTNVLDAFIENFNFNTADSVIVKVIAYVKANYTQDLKLEALGDMFNCNSAYLGKRFKKYTGQQFNTYLDNLRIEDAKDKLLNTDLKIYQISKLVGYANTDYFFMKFKKSTGMTPKEFKNGSSENTDSTDSTGKGSGKKTLILMLFMIACVFISCNKKPKEAVEAPVTFTFFSSDLSKPQYFNDLIAKEITKRTGVTLKFEYSTETPDDAINLMIANANYQDFIYAKGNLSKLIEQNAVIKLDEYIEKYGQNMKKLYGDQLSRLRYTLDNPYIYSVGTYEIKNKVMEVSGNMPIQNAVLKEFGYPRIKTLEDYENILLAYMKKYPEINGHKTIGISLVTDSWYWYLGLSNPGNYVIGYPDDGQWIVNQETMEATYKFLYPEMKLFYKWLNKIYHEGLLDPESFTQDIDVWNSKLKDGYVLGTSYPYWGLKDINRYLVQNDLDQRTFAFLPVTYNENYKDPALKDYGYSGGWGIAISKDCKNPVRAFKFLDWMCSEEAQILVNWGIEGKHYYYDKNGRRVAYPNIDENDGVGRYIYPFPEAGGGYIDSTGNPMAKLYKENIIENYSSAEKETLSAYGAELWADLFPTSQELGVSKHGQVWQYPLSSQMTKVISEVDDYVKESLIKMILAPEKDFDSNWEEMRENIIKMGMIEINNQCTELIKMKMKLWEK